MAIKEKLDAMVGKTYETGDRVATVEKWKFILPNYLIITTAKTYVFDQNEIENRIDEWSVHTPKDGFVAKPVVNTLKKNITDTEDDFEKEKPQLPAIIEEKDLYESNSNYKNVQDKLMEMMNSISSPEASTETLLKANTACNVASTMIALERLNLQVKKANERSQKIKR